jgi:hypothetical protein
MQINAVSRKMNAARPPKIPKNAIENGNKRIRATVIGSDLADPLGRVVILGNKPSRGTE